VSWLSRIAGGRRRRSATATAAVDDLFRSLLLHVDPEPLAASAVARFSELADCDAVALFLIDAERGDLCLNASTGMWPSRFLESRWPCADGLARWLSINEQPLLVNQDAEVVDDLSRSEAAALRASGAAVIIPLEAANRLTGFLCFGPTRAATGWTSEEARRVATLAVPAALAFEHAVLVREAESRLRRLYRAERLATAGTIAAGLAHEIRNPLTAIRSGIQMVRDQSGEADDTVEVLDEVIHEVDRIDRLVGGLLMFARAPRASFGEVDMVDVVSRALALVEAQARRRGLALEVDLPPQMPLWGDAGQLEQVVLNLLLNAVEAGGDGTVAVSLTATGDQPGSKVGRLTVKDCGPGIAAEHSDRVFDPFFTTKRDGSGLGLPISFQIVRRHGGELTLSAAPEGGTVATVKLPQVLEVGCRS
jgi:signal transduction histidine kinase